MTNSMLDCLIATTPYDNISTPSEALFPLLPYLRYGATIWEMCPGEGRLTQHLKTANQNFNIIKINEDSLIDEPTVEYEYILTNPPYSNKHEWLQRCVELSKPFAILLPVTTLGVKRCQIWMDDVDVLFLPKRIDFTGKKAPWFAVAWFTRNMLPDRMVFAEK